MLLTVYRFLKTIVLFYGKNYKRMYKRNCSVVKYVSQETFQLVEIQFFFQFHLDGNIRDLVFLCGVFLTKTVS